MMEAVLVMPIIILLIFFIIQFTFVLLARQMTYYAAYCGARAALVYNPVDYSGDGGVVKRAAYMVLAWISQSTKGSNPIVIPADDEDYVIPRSEDIDEQVEVSVNEDLLSANNVPLVKVTVTFHCPLLIPLGGRVMATIAGSSGTGDSHGWHSVPLQESCTLAKPYRTETFPLIPLEDKQALGMEQAAQNQQ